MCVPYSKLGDAAWWSGTAALDARGNATRIATSNGEARQSRSAWLHPQLGAPRSEALASMIAALDYGNASETGEQPPRPALSSLAEAVLAPAVRELRSCAACPEETDA